MDEQKRIILGIDASTSCLGTSIAIYDGNNVNVLYVHYVKMKSSKDIKGTDSLFEKAQQFKENFVERVKDWGITDIVIEEPLPNSQNINTVNSLLKFNGMISQSLYEATGIVPQYISSYEARKYAFPELMAIRKYNKNDEEYDLKKIIHALKNNELVLFGGYSFSCQKKHILRNKIIELYPDIKWTYDKKQNLTVENFDASDSLVCILGYINKIKYMDQVPSIIKYNINKDKLEKEIEVTYTVNFCDKIMDKTIYLTKNNNI